MIYSTSNYPLRLAAKPNAKQINVASDKLYSIGGKMSLKQLEVFFAKAKTDKKLQHQIEECGSNNSCVVDIGKRYGHKFSPARVSRWHRDHVPVK